jgi:hypothetical protein
MPADNCADNGRDDYRVPIAGQLDPYGEAVKIENLAKSYFDHSPEGGKAIENSIVAAGAIEGLRTEFTHLLQDPQEFRSVSEQLEQLGGEVFTTLPKVNIKANNGSVTEMEFRPSNWDFTAGGVIYADGNGVILASR